MGETRKKEKTPKAVKEAVRQAPHVREGDILLLSGAWNSSFPDLGVVVETAAGRDGTHKVVDERGRKREVSKVILNPVASTAYMGEITIVGHDEEWMKLEKGLDAKRRAFAGNHKDTARIATTQLRMKKAAGE